jgi:hypothetical protein
LPLGPLEPVVRLLAPEVALRHARAVATPDQVGAVVTQERSGHRGRHHEGEAEISGAGDHAGRDHQRLARHDGHERVEKRDGEDDRVRPPGRIRDKLGELVKHPE